MTEVPKVRLGNYIEVCNARNSDLKCGIDMIEGATAKTSFAVAQLLPKDMPNLRENKIVIGSLFKMSTHKKR